MSKNLGIDFFMLRSYYIFAGVNYTFYKKDFELTCGGVVNAKFDARTSSTTIVPRKVR